MGFEPTEIGATFDGRAFLYLRSKLRASAIFATTAQTEK